jgi:hypothetical protein
LKVASLPDGRPATTGWFWNMNLLAIGKVEWSFMIEQTISDDTARANSVKSADLQFVLEGLTHDAESRIFAFTGIAHDRTRTEFTVRVDLSHIRKYGIRIQELPLLCRELLQNRVDLDARALVFTEGEMRFYEDQCVALRLVAAEKRKAPKRQPVQNAASGWMARQPG